MHLKSFTFNPFQENTYVLWDDTGECAIIDPGCREPYEKNELKSFIEEEGLKPVLFLLTHAHLDHIFGARFVADTWQLSPKAHPKEKQVYDTAPSIGMMYGVSVEPLPHPDYSISEGSQIKFGNTTLEIRFTPGHSPGSVCYIHNESKTIIAGDVLFAGSIGRTDLPGGDYRTLINSIQCELLVLDDEYTVYSGHGPETEIGIERKENPFLL